MKKLSILALVAVLVLTGCSSNSGDDSSEDTEQPAVTAPITEPESEPSASETEMMVFTKDQLEEYDGDDGMPIYIAIDGIVYDVSDISAWAGGKHQDLVEAGDDLSDYIKNAPHGKTVLENLPIVGTLVD